MTVNLCNNNPKSPNAVKFQQGIFGGVTSRDRYNVLPGEPTFPFQYQCWQVRDLQDGKWYVVVKHGNVETRSCTCKDYNENYKKYGDGTWASFGFAKYACEHIRAVALYLDECRKDARKREKSAPQTTGEHAQYLLEGWGNLVKPHTTGAAKKEFWDGVRIYANRRDINPDELTKAVLKKIFPAPQTEAGIKSTDFWTDEVKAKMEAAKKDIRDRRNGSSKSKVTFHLKRCPSCGIAIDPKKQRCSKCVDGMLNKKLVKQGYHRTDGTTTTNASIRNPMEPEAPKMELVIHKNARGKYSICEDDNGFPGDVVVVDECVMLNYFKDMRAAKVFAKKRFPEAQVTTLNSI